MSIINELKSSVSQLNEAVGNAAEKAKKYTVDSLNTASDYFIKQFGIQDEIDSVKKFFNPESTKVELKGIKRFPKNIQEEKAFILIPYEYNAKNVNYYSNIKFVENPTEGSIVLPAPTSGLIQNDNHSWNEEEGLGSTMLNQVGLNVGQGLYAAGTMFSKQLMEGNFINDYASLLYNGTAFRTYMFDWELSFESKEDVISFFEILTLIRKFSLPDYNKYLTKYPYFWKIFPVKRQNQFNLYLKDCVITNLIMNYAPSGIIQLHSSGHPLQVTLSIEFKELFRASRNDLK